MILKLANPFASLIFSFNGLSDQNLTADGLLSGFTSDYIHSLWQPRNINPRLGSGDDLFSVDGKNANFNFPKGVFIGLYNKKIICRVGKYFNFE